MARSTKRRRGRAIATGIVCVALVGGAVYAIAVHKPKASSTIDAPSIFRTATASKGDLTTTQKVDGTVQLSATLAVLHRIEGQTSSSVNSNASSTANPTNATTASTPSSNRATPTTTPSSVVAADCTATTTPATTTPATATPATTTPAPATPDTGPVTPTTVDATSGSTVDTTPADTTTTTPPAQPAPAQPAPAPPATTTPCDIPTTTVPSGNAPGGGSRTGGGGTRTGGGGGRSTGGASRSTGGSSNSAASSARATQTITSITSPNAPVNFGDVLYTVDGEPVVALDGALPAWRSLSTSSADGADVAQLESSLVAMGYDPAQKVTVDDHFDSATRTMVKAWQQGLGVAQTGTVSLGSVVFLPAATTVSTVERAVGDSVGDGDTVLTLATSTQQVLVDVPAGDEASVVPGLAVGIGDVPGTVSRLQSADQNGSVVVEAVISPSAQITNATNGSSVKVTLTLQNDTGVLIVPAEALVSRLDGSYAVEVKNPNGTTAWQTVQLLGVSGANVAISGAGVSQGTVVLLPA